MARHVRRSSHARPTRRSQVLGELLGHSAAGSAHLMTNLRGTLTVQVLGSAAIGLVLAASIPAFAATTADASGAVASAAIAPPVATRLPAGPPSQASAADISKVLKAETKERRVAAKARADRAAERKVAAAKKAAAAKKVAVRKARAVAAAKLARSWVWPVANPNIGTRFGATGDLWASGRHTGVDFPKPTGTPVRAATSGIVIFAGTDGPYGNVVRLRHANGAQTWYGHLSKIIVKKGQRVTTKQQIGKVGSTGNSTGPHLHFEVLPKPTAAAIDPIPWLKKRGVIRS